MNKGMSHPVISVITTTLNAGDKLLATRESVAKQKGNSWEHIVKDGGSTDNSIDKINHLIPGAHIINSQDSGIYDGMNQGALAATGKYLHFLNSGDIYTCDDALQKVSEIAESNDWPDLVVIWYHNSADGIINSYPKKLGAWYLYRHSLCHQAVFISRKLFLERGGHDTGFQLLADHDLLFDLILNKHCRYVVTYDVLVNYDGEGVTSETSRLKQKDREARLVRKRNFGAIERNVFRIIHEMTLWRLRRFLLRQRSLQSLTRLYYRLFARINRSQ